MTCHPARAFNFISANSTRTIKPACQKLYEEARIGGQIPPNDSGLDIDDIHEAYIATEGNNFFVAEAEGKSVIGMIGVLHSDGMGEIRRLRVRGDVRGHGIGMSLLRQAVQHCVDRNYLKVALDTYIEKPEAIKLFAEHHYRVDRAQAYAGKEMIYFYLDLYTSDAKEDQS